jgi:two-component system, chemotaxis family, response regulator Rcp1
MTSNRCRAVLRILLVDDDPAAVRLLQESFWRVNAPHTFDVVRDGQEALDFLHRRGPFAHASTPDLVLLDLNMPKRTGFDVLRELKATPELRQIIVIVFSTSTETRDVMTAYSCSANCFVGKPHDFSGYCRVARGIDQFWGGAATLPRDAAACSTPPA